MIQVLSLRGRGGVRPCGEYVGRPSALGNPFLVGRDGTREDVIGRYRRWLRAQWRHGGAVRQELERLAAKYRRDGPLTLLCWCAPRPCHADVIREAVLGMCAKEVR
jgi:Domain of unknown function (DUF4326)